MPKRRKVPSLLDRLEEFFLLKEVGHYMIPLSRYDLVARLKAQGNLIGEETTNTGFKIRAYPKGKLKNS